MLSLRVVGAVLGASLFAAAPGLTAPKPRQVVPAANSAVVQHLHHVVKLLNEADHDYDGYRAKAVHNVHKAIKALEPHHHAPAPVAPGTKPPAPKEKQEKSDGQLKEALKTLGALQGTLQGLAGKHHQQAALDVAAAMTDLNTALKIR